MILHNIQINGIVDNKDFLNFFSWFCHVDDDIYVILSNLVKLLSKMDPKTDLIYIDRTWKRPVSVSWNS